MRNVQGIATPADEPSLLVHAYLDGELDPANSLAIARQIDADPTLRAEAERIEAVRAVV
jgi:anti-sigma factor RsiW